MEQQRKQNQKTLRVAAQKRRREVVKTTRSKQQKKRHIVEEKATRDLEQAPTTGVSGGEKPVRRSERIRNKREKATRNKQQIYSRAQKRIQAQLRQLQVFQQKDAHAIPKKATTVSDCTKSVVAEARQDPVDVVTNSVLGLHLTDADLLQMMQPVSWEEMMFRAQDFRKTMHNALPIHVCAVCGLYRSRKEVGTSVTFDSMVKYFDILRVNAASTPNAPRHGKTKLEYKGIEYCLQAAGLSGAAENKCITVCNSCRVSLYDKRIPRESLVLVDAGMRPPGLPEMTLLESLIVSPLRPMRYFAVVKPHWSHGDTSQFTEALRAHVVAYPNPPCGKITGIFPMNIEDIPNHFLVALITAADCIETARMKAKKVQAIQVRGSVIAMNARYFATVWNEHSFEMSEPNLLAYGNFNGVPVSILKQLIYAKTQSEVDLAQLAFRGDREGSSSARFGSAVERGAFTVNDHDSGLSARDFAASNVCMQGIDDVDLEMDPTDIHESTTTIQGSEYSETRLTSSFEEHGVLAVATAKTPTPYSDYDPKWFLYCHPNTFFYDSGGCPKGMSLRVWGNIMLRRYPREQYQQNVKLLLDIFDIDTRHQVNTQSFVQLKINPDSMKVISEMSETEVTLTKQLLVQNVRGLKLKTFLNHSTLGVRTLYQAFYTVTSRIQGSPGRFRKFKSLLDSVWNMCGEWTCAFNLNPAPMSSPAFFQLAGMCFTVDDMPTKTKRWILLAKNPTAAAQFFICFMDTFADKMLGWPKGAKTQQRRGIAGELIAWAYKPECTERAVLHAHAVAVQPVMLARRFALLVKDKTFQNSIFAFMESVTQNWLPSPYYTCLIRPEEDHDVKCAVNHEAHGHTINLQAPLRRSSEEPELVRASIPEITRISKTEFKVAGSEEEIQLKEWIAKCGLHFLWHFHTATCGKNGFSACDEGCRVSMPRMLVRKTHLYEDTSLVLMRRDIGQLASYNMSMLAAEPCNHAFYLMAHCDVFWRDLNIWRDKRNKGITKALPPRIPSFEEHAADKATYTSSYVSKPDLSFANDKLVNITDCLNDIRRSEGEPRLGDGREGKTFLARMINTVHGRLTYPASLIAAYLLGEGDFTISNELQTLDLQQFVSFIDAGGDRSRMAYHASTPLTGMSTDVLSLVKQTKENKLSSTLQDYLYRDPLLRHLSLLLYTMFYEKKRRDDKFEQSRMDYGVSSTRSCNHGRPLQARYRFVPPHDQSASHMMMRRNHYKLQQIFMITPYRPDDDSLQLQSKLKYAAFAIALCAPILEEDVASTNGCWHAIGDDETLWDVYVRWRNNSMPTWAKVVLDQMQLKREAHSRNRQRHCMRRTSMKDAMDEDENAASDSESSEDEAVRQLDLLSDAVPETPLSTPNVVAIESSCITAIAETLTSQTDLQSKHYQSEHLYLQAAERTLPILNCNARDSDLLHPPPYSTEIVRQLQQDMSAHTIRQWAQKAEAESVRRQSGFGKVNAKVDTSQKVLEFTHDPVTRRLRGCIYTFDVNELIIQTAVIRLDEHEGRKNIPPFVRMKEIPTHKLVIEVFQLTEDQAFAFLIMADAFDKCAAGWHKSYDQRRLIVQGDPGTGKSQVIISFLWYAFQCGRSNEVVAVSYTWRAADEISNEYYRGVTTSMLLTINSVAGNTLRTDKTSLNKLQLHLAGRKMIIIDECSFNSCAHEDAINKSLLTAAKLNATTTERSPKLMYMAERTLNEINESVHDGGYHVVRFGDLNQHEPPSQAQKPLQYLASQSPESILKIAASDSESDQKNYRGRKNWSSIVDVVFLRQNHRIENNADGREMHDLYEPFMRRGPVTRVDAEKLCDAIQRKTLTGPIPPNSSVLVLRNTVRSLLVDTLIRQEAQRLCKRLIVWKTEYFAEDGLLLPSVFECMLRKLPGQKNGDIEASFYFFEGVEYLFCDSKQPFLGQCKNKVAQGIQLILDPRESIDDMSGNCWKLTYVPLAVIVRPENCPCDDICGDNSIPPGCFPIEPQTIRHLALSLPTPISVDGVEYRCIKYSTLGFRLSYKVSFTDYFAQGMSFRPPKQWICHLNPPPTGTFHGKSIFVSLSRFVRYSNFHSLCPLWPSGDTNARDKVVDKYFKAMHKNLDLEAEFKRLDLLAEKTRDRYPEASILAKQITAD